jgi:hypothetical protein
VERLGAPTASGSDVRTAGDELPRHRGVVAERGGMQRRVAFVDLRQTLGQEELGTPSQTSSHQERSRIEHSHRSPLIRRRDRYQDLGQVAHSAENRSSRD